ncbi:MAG TPA: NfeD family protein [Candidatus Limnocylindria bacterium]|nr:NfeD family protein [Candidatus Limnocylindria bacterium]
MDLFLAYVLCFGVGLVFTLISAFMADVFGGHDAGGGHEGAGGHAEAGFEGSDMPGFSALSPTTIASFITAFGGIGMVLSKIEKTSSPWISVPLSAVGGFVIAGIVLALFRTVFRHTQASSEARVFKLIGTTGTIITPIPANGVGEIAYVNGGTRYTAPARSLSGNEIGNGKPVKIARIVGSQFYVELI